MNFKEIHEAKLEAERHGFWRGVVLTSIAYVIALTLMAAFGDY